MKKKSLKNIKGATLIEYGIIVAVIAVVAIAVMTLLSEDITAFFEGIGTTLENATDSVSK